MSGFVAAAPGSIGNLGPGLDVLGCAVEGASDEVAIDWAEAPGIVVADSGHPDLPCDPERNTAAIAAAAVFALARGEGNLRHTRGAILRVKKGLPLSGGQGGSAASAVAGALAANALAGAKLSMADLARCALEAESRVAGRHLDNIAPSLLGGIVLVRSVDPIDLVKIPVPEGLWVALASPHQRLETATSRGALPNEIPLSIAVHQMAQVGAIVAACASGDLALLGRAIDDRLAEPARANLIPGFAEAKRAALRAGALGVSISGAGPTVFALAASKDAAGRAGSAIGSAWALAGIKSTVRWAMVDRVGATVKPA